MQYTPLSANELSNNEIEIKRIEKTVLTLEKIEFVILLNFI